MINDAVSLSTSGTQLAITQSLIKTIADAEKQIAAVLEQALLTVPVSGNLGGNVDISA
jgi:hypothetical protein